MSSNPEDDTPQLKQGTAGNDTITGGNAGDSLHGEAGDDTIHGNGGADAVFGGAGNDTVYGGEGGDAIYGQSGDDTLHGEGGDDGIYGGSGKDKIYGGDGNDTLYGENGDDTIDGGAGDDVIYAGDGNDQVYGGLGYDVIYGGGDNDVLDGGDDGDTIIISFGETTTNFNTTVKGGSGGDDNDTLDISNLIEDGWNITGWVQNPESNGMDGYNGQITLQRGDQWANINYEDIENFQTEVVCFTPGSLISTTRGLRPVETLVPGDLVYTRDNGPQPLRWIGQRQLGVAELRTAPSFAPVMIRKDAFGPNCPERDMMVSPNHRMLVESGEAQLMFGEDEVLVPSKHLVGAPGVSRRNPGALTYVHLMFDNHEIIRSDGVWSESFQPASRTMSAMGRDQQNEIEALFPELATVAGLDDYRAARFSLKRHEAELLRACA
ncbi:Hint domain-containing protein [Heliomarina baculiformis]|uniref:Hint domain-containing protein n=1 Tax=Heliomarina baculiformis TaxID=2872036 RepID=UPI001EE1FD33|nr:Hint domain-containing protein [Heliomarina baculiformis]